jgi:hypothetical protein
MRTLEDFTAAIDCRSPYNDHAAAAALIDEACTISTEAVFMVVHELARLPRSVQTTAANRLALLDRLAAKLEHPLKVAVFDVARRMIRGEELRTAGCPALMRRIEAYPGEGWTALNVVYSACEEAGFDAVDVEYQRILAAFRSAT